MLGNLEVNGYLEKSKASRAMYYKTNPDMVILSENKRKSEKDKRGSDLHDYLSGHTGTAAGRNGTDCRGKGAGPSGANYLNQEVMAMEGKPMFLRFLNKFVLLFEAKKDKSIEHALEKLLQKNR